MNVYQQVFVLALALFLSGCHSTTSQKQESGGSPEGAPRIVNIINFIRQTEPRISEYTDEVLYQTVVEQVKILNQYHLKGTFLLQYDALLNPQYQTLLKEKLVEGSEVGAWWEITQPHVEAAGLKWRGRYPWDWHANVGFATGYSPAEREKLVDVYMAKFQEVFGYYPASVGSWFIDAHTLGYLYDKYHIVASCNCKDQIGTDGYTLWGGYWGQGYYPSRKNAYMPAQTPEGQIPVPIFRMLGSDPLYQYDTGLGSGAQGVISLEPVYGSSGCSASWVDWFFAKLFTDPCLGFTYTQAGQENSFTWEKMKQGYELQIPRLATLREQGVIQVQTLAESGHWYKERYPLTPPTALSALSDYQPQDRKTVWFNSRFYRANLLWEGASFRFRDIHLFHEDYASSYLHEAGTSTQCIYTTLPFVDGYQWSTPEALAGLRLYTQDASGHEVEVQGKAPLVQSHGKTLQVEWPLEGNPGSFLMTLSEKKLSIAYKGAKDFPWSLKLTTCAEAPLPFGAITAQKAEATLNGFPYSIECKKGTLLDRRSSAPGAVLEIQPAHNHVVLGLKTK